MKMSVLAYTYDKTQKTRNLIIQLLTIRPQREAIFINLPNTEREARLAMERCGIKKQRV